MGSVIGIGGIVVMLLISSFIIVAVTEGYSPVKRSIVSTDGKIMSFTNEANILFKTFNSSIEFIAQRAAYDLGNTGGIDGSGVAIWDTTKPDIPTLKAELVKKIEKTFSSIEEGEKTIEWRESTMDISNYDTTCGPIEDSKCFLIKGKRNIYIYDKSLEAETNFNFTFNNMISSSYFRLLEVGRKILSSPAYFNLLIGTAADRTTLEKQIFTDYKITASIIVNGDYIEVNLIDSNCIVLNQYQCIAPLNYTEPKTLTISGNLVPYNVLSLNYRFYNPGLWGYLEVNANDNLGNLLPADVTVIADSFIKNGDLNIDGVIDQADFNLFTPHIGNTVPPDLPIYDIVVDGRINILDSIKISVNKGKTAPHFTTYFITPVEEGNVHLIANYNGVTKTQTVTINGGATTIVNFVFP